jgi:hypothetical protein
MVDADARRAGHVVTAVRFDGVDEPSYRAPAVCAQRLETWSEINVHTGTPRALVIRTLGDTAVMASSLAGDAARVGEAFRQGDLGPAQAMLPQLVDGIRDIAAITDTCATALDLRVEEIRCQNSTFDRWLNEFGRRLAVVLEAQAQRDWVTLADSLEFDIEPSLGEWATVLDDLSTATARVG